MQPTFAEQMNTTAAGLLLYTQAKRARRVKRIKRLLFGQPSTVYWLAPGR